MVQIEVAKEKCPSPRECRKCLEVCPESVFMTYPQVGRSRKPGKPAQDWVIAPVYLTLCTGCRICEEICPQNAIVVTTAAQR